MDGRRIIGRDTNVLQMDTVFCTTSMHLFVSNKYKVIRQLDLCNYSTPSFPIFVTLVFFAI